jgi:hypothetical protein
MKRIFVVALPLVVLACSGKTDEGGKSGGGTGSGGITETGSGGAPEATGGVSVTGTGGESVTGSGGAPEATGGGTETGSGGAPEATGGVSEPGSGGVAQGGTGGVARGGAGGVARGGRGGSTQAGSGGRSAAGTGGVAGEGTGGRAGATGGAGTTGGSGPDGIATGPTPVDPEAAAADLPHYYISNSGDDGNTGQSPEDAWATVAKVPANTPAAVYFERGGTFTAAGGPARGRNGPAAFNVPKGSVWTAYGDGDARPILRATEATAGSATGAVLSPGGNVLLVGLSFTGQANFGLLMETDDNVIQDCEIDGEIEGSMIQLGFSVRGHHNVVVGNYIHSLHEVILDSGNVNTSGGAEAIVVNGTDHEIAYNTIVDCWTPNETLGGAEGGCLEIIARSPGEVVENILFHHNYCERSVGLFEACAGNFAGTAEKVQEHHAVVRNTVLAYNVVMDAMWLYLLQTVNTDMDGLVFEHNTLVHGTGNTDIPQQGAPGFGNFYDTDRFVPATSCSAASDCAGGPTAICMNGNCCYQTKAQPGQITVRNNFFVVLQGAKAATMRLPPGPDDVLNNIFSPQAPSGVTASAGHVTVVSDPGLVNNSYRITATSPAVDQGGQDAVKPWPDFEGNAVPCGDAPDVGAVEYCP